MTGEHLEAQARRVVTGLDADGRSCFVRDEDTPDRLPGPGNTKCDIWRMGSLPTTYAADAGLEDGVVTAPPKGGLVHRVTTFPPDSEWDKSAGYADSQGKLAGSVPDDESGIPGLHHTDTVDIVTVLSGEVWAVMETGETLLKPGDTLVQRGTKHAWANRSDRPVTVVSVMVSATS